MTEIGPGSDYYWTESTRAVTRTYKGDLGGLLTFLCAQCFGGPTLKQSSLTGRDGRTPLDAHLVDAIVCKLSFGILAHIST